MSHVTTPQDVTVPSEGHCTCTCTEYRCMRLPCVHVACALFFASTTPPRRLEETVCRMQCGVRSLLSRVLYIFHAYNGFSHCRCTPIHLRCFIDSPCFYIILIRVFSHLCAFMCVYSRMRVCVQATLDPLWHLHRHPLYDAAYTSVVASHRTPHPLSHVPASATTHVAATEDSASASSTSTPTTDVDDGHAGADAQDAHVSQQLPRVPSKREDMKMVMDRQFGLLSQLVLSMDARDPAACDEWYPRVIATVERISTILITERSGIADDGIMTTALTGSEPTRRKNLFPNQATCNAHYPNLANHHRSRAATSGTSIAPLGAPSGSAPASASAPARRKSKQCSLCLKHGLRSQARGHQKNWVNCPARPLERAAVAAAQQAAAQQAAAEQAASAQ